MEEKEVKKRKEKCDEVKKVRVHEKEMKEECNNEKSEQRTGRR